MVSMQGVSRRGFVGGVAGALGYLGLKPGADLWAQGHGSFEAARLAMQSNEYDGMAKLANNENPWGPSDRLLESMNQAWKYSNRYGYPDPGIQGAIAAHHGVGPENILIGAGSSETLTVVGQTFLAPGKKIVGCMPTYMSVYNYATGQGAEGLTIPVLEDGTQDIEAMVRLAKRNYRDVGFFYLVNPNNPTAVVVPRDEVQYVIDELPEDMTILIDEAYHHFVEDPRYETAIPYVKEGRNVIVARTFSKIYGLAGMRLGYGVAPSHIIERMRRTITGTQNINALVKFAGVAALADTAEEQRVRNSTNAMRKQVVGSLEAVGYKVLPSEANFFMVHIRRPVQEVIPMFRERGVLVGRAFPPMNDWMRVSVGLEEENARFVTAFRQIFTGATSRG
jgi:histidinol-phosphate aminotransferase